MRPLTDIALTTHINADGDGVGSEVAMFHYLRRRGARPVIVNPGAVSAQYSFLLGDLTVLSANERAGQQTIADAELVLLLDTSEPSRLGAIADRLEGKSVAVIDHHPATATSIGSPAVIDPSACATGELVYDLFTVEGERVTREQAEALYAAVVTDTGSFRYSNTSPRCLEVAAALIRAGVDPASMYRHLYGQLTPERLDLVKRALASLHASSDVPMAWITLSWKDIAASGDPAEDMEGLIEYARRLRGVEVAVLMRQLADGRTKVSLRSNGDVNVADIARQFGGGGHDKAAGALLSEGIETAEPVVVEAVRRAIAASTRA